MASRSVLPREPGYAVEHRKGQAMVQNGHRDSVGVQHMRTTFPVLASGFYCSGMGGQLPMEGDSIDALINQTRYRKQSKLPLQCLTPEVHAREW